MKTLILFVLAVIFACVPTNAIIISSPTPFQRENVGKVYFTDSPTAEVTVQVMDLPLKPDFTFKIVRDPKEADLIFVDGYAEADMHVAKVTSQIGAMTIRVARVAAKPDIRIYLSAFAVKPDYKIYISSNTFTEEEVASLFGIVLMNEKKK